MKWTIANAENTVKAALTKLLNDDEVKNNPEANKSLRKIRKEMKQHREICA